MMEGVSIFGMMVVFGVFMTRKVSDPLDDLGVKS